MELSRRRVFAGLGALVAAPAIVHVSALMPLRGVPLYARGNQLLTMEMITREAVRLFASSNAFLQNLDEQYSDEFGIAGAKIGTTLRIRLPNDYAMRSVVLVPDIQLAAPEAALIGTAAVMAKNPVMSRRFWG